MAIGRRLRYEILRRDCNACRYCGATAPDVPLTVDHVVPTALGGSDDPTNLVTACKDCNAGKASSSPDAPIVANVADDALRWAAAMSKAAEVQAGHRAERKAYVDQFEAAWADWFRLADKSPIPRPEGWRNSIERFFDLNLELEVLVAAVRTAMARVNQGQFAEFKYMCGICWSVLRERQEIAEGLIETEGD